MSNGQDDLSQFPTVSIGLPVFNGENYVAETIESLLAQTYTDFEIVICDNASTDRTEAICKDYQERDSRIRYHRQTRNLGACRNYDMTFELSRGRYFKWHSHDDLITADFLEKLVPVLDADPDCVLVHPYTVLIDTLGAKTGTFEDDIDCQSEEPAERLAHWLFPSKGLCNPIFGLMRRNVVARTGLHGDFLGSDRVFIGWMTLLGRCKCVPEYLFFRRFHDMNSMRTNTNAIDRAVWFSGRKPKLPPLKCWGHLRGYLTAIRRTKMPGPQRRAAYAVARRWVLSKRRELIKELLLPLYYNGKYTSFGRVVRQTLSPALSANPKD